MKSKRLSWIVGVFKEEIKDIGSKIDSAMCLLPQLDGPKCKWWARVIRPPSSQGPCRIIFFSGTSQLTCIQDHIYLLVISICSFSSLYLLIEIQEFIIQQLLSQKPKHELQFLPCPKSEILKCHFSHILLEKQVLARQIEKEEKYIVTMTESLAERRAESCLKKQKKNKTLQTRNTGSAFMMVPFK